MTTHTEAHKTKQLPNAPVLQGQAGVREKSWDALRRSRHCTATRNKFDGLSSWARAQDRSAQDESGLRYPLQ